MLAVCLLALVGRSAAQVLTPQQTSLLLLKVGIAWIIIIAR